MSSSRAKGLMESTVRNKLNSKHNLVMVLYFIYFTIIRSQLNLRKLYSVIYKMNFIYISKIQLDLFVVSN